MEKLTPKERTFIDLMMSGKNQTEAAFEAFDCKTKKAGSVIGTRIMKKTEVSNELAKRRELMLEKQAEKDANFAEMVVNKVGGRDNLAKMLAEIAESGDTRAKLEALEKIFKLSALYPPQRVVEMIALEDHRKKTEGRLIIQKPGEKGIEPEALGEEDVVITFKNNIKEEETEE